MDDIKQYITYLDGTRPLDGTWLLGAYNMRKYIQSDLITSQHRTKPKFMAWASVLLDHLDDGGCKLRQITGLEMPLNTFGDTR